MNNQRYFSVFRLELWQQPSRFVGLIPVITLGIIGGSVLCLVERLPAQDPAAMQAWGDRYAKEILPLIQSHCLECHNADDPNGEFDLSGMLTAEAAIAKPTVWDQVGKRIRLNEMPPAGSRQFTDPEKGRVYSWLDAKPADDHCENLATDETQAWYKGYVMSRRLTRTEYLNSMRDLIGLVVADRFEIPSDGAGGVGFDTNGSTLFTSPIHIEQYLAAATDTLSRAMQSESHRQRLLGDFDPAVDAKSQAIQVLERFATRAWRRPLSTGEIERLVALLDFAWKPLKSDGSVANGESKTGRAAWPLEARLAVQHAMTGVVISPNFLFIVESEAPEGGVQKLTPFELATRLSMFLWSSIPDDRLLAAAADGRLETPEEVISETQRMLSDPRARALGENFGLQWLGLANFLGSTAPDKEIFPDFDRELAIVMREEVIRTIARVFQEDRPVRELIASSTIEVNRRLAEHYGIELEADSESTTVSYSDSVSNSDSDSDSEWWTVSVDQQPRGGVITTAAVLTLTSYPRRTSPVLRGRWLLEEVIGARVPPPPPGVPPLEDAVATEVKSLRERLELHRANPECASCHNRMDPLGFGLENFDGVGRWRDSDHGLPIDSQGTLPDGQTFSGPQELKQVLLSREGEFRRHLTRKMLGFALGRELTKFDDCVIDDALKALESNDGRGRAIIETIVTSYAFQHRYFKAAVQP